MIVPAVAQVEAIQQIGRKVIARIGIPKDRWEIAAQLEVLGLRDVDARERFGHRDLFEAADTILALFRDGTLPHFVEPEPAERRARGILRFLHRYFDGLMFSFPMVLQGSAMLLWGYGLWGAIDLDVRTGSAIALGFIASCIATSGFAQAIVRRGLFYFYQNEGGLARWSVLRMWWVSLRAILALLAPALLFNLLYGFLPWDMFLLGVAYYVGLVILWLNWSLNYLVGKTHWFLAALTFAILAVVAAARVAGWPIVAANLLGMAIADAMTYAIALVGLNQWARNGAGKPTVNPPRLTVLIYSTVQVFLYGFLYNAFIFTDRILAWTSARGREDFPPYPFWLSARYELGMDLALIVVVLLSGIVEHATHQFSSMLVPGGKSVKSNNLAPLIEEFRALYRKHATILCICAVPAIALSLAVANALRRFPDPRFQESLTSATTVEVFWVAAVSYAVLMLGLQNVLLLMTLSRPDLVVRAFGLSLLVNVAVGFAISRAVHYSGAVYGLLAGSVVLAILSHRQIRLVLGEIDYYYYAAY